LTLCSIVLQEILLQKLGHYGMRGNVNNLFRFYLIDRSQYITINDTNLSTSSVNYGIPQGSNLGPLLFSIYVNHSFNNFVSPPVIVRRWYLKFRRIRKTQTAWQWMIVNKLTINTVKSNAIIVLHVTTKKSIPKLSIHCNGILITIQDHVKYLGVIFDNKLNFQEHIHQTEKKNSCGVGILSKLKYFFTKRTLLQLYYTLIYSYLQLLYQSGGQPTKVICINY